MLQSSKTSPWGRLACASVICWEKGARGSGAMWAAKSGEQTVLQIRSQLPLGSHLSIKVPLKSAVRESCGPFPFPMGIYFFYIQMQMVLPLTKCQSNGHTTDFLPKVILAWSLESETQFSEYYKTNFHAFTLQEINKFYTVTDTEMKQ